MPENLHTSNISSINSFQEKELKIVLNYLNTNSSFYKKLFSKHKISIDEINTIEDLQKIPFTKKEDLQEFNNDFICVPQSKIIDYVTTSGTMGDPVTIALTDKDLDRLAFNECNSYKITGGRYLIGIVFDPKARNVSKFEWEMV